VDNIKIINEMEGDRVVQVGATAFAEEKHVSLSKRDRPEEPDEGNIRG